MIKMRLQGTKNDIRWFLKVLEKDKRFDLVDTSDFYQIKTSNRFKRLYTNVYTDPRWCTYKQAEAKGWHVKRGEKGVPIEFWSMYDKEEKRKLVILIIVSLVSIMYFGARTAITSYHNYEEQKAESDDTEEANTASGSAVSSEAVTTGEATEESNETQTEETQHSTEEYEVDTSGMATFLGYMSDQAYETLIKLTEDKCRELGVNSAKKLDFQRVGATEYDVIGYILVGNDKVCECAYNLKSDVVSINDTTYMESDIRDMEAARRKAEADELKKEQEEAKEAEEEEAEEDTEKDAAKEKDKKKGKKKSASNKTSK